ncbi:hypothetical protein DID75_05340 [Candidatus Marinamargulisbacteria bacterium SCGC AG-410-N11]|nr:hypothetical protein DID75_05340 [Candidatus Marinamargulisbacteria bacterium SCGC AG-410-N11]
MIRKDVCIIGAGLAGLTAANVLAKHGLNFCILESSDSVGGRVKTSHVDSFKCDHGFQVFLPAYPTAKKFLNYNELNLHYYPKGAVIHDSRKQWFGAPFSYQKKWQYGSRLKASFKDYSLLLFDCLNGKYPTNLVNNKSTHKYLKNRFSSNLSNQFLLPFFRGIFLDYNCNASYQLYQYYLSLFFKGGAAIPYNGMQEIPLQLAKNLPKEYIQLSSKVTHITDNRVYLENGQVIVATKILFACDQRSVCQLVPAIAPPIKSRSVATFFFKVSELSELAPLNFILTNRSNFQISIPTLINQNYNLGTKHHLCMVTSLDLNISKSEILKYLSPSLGKQVNQWEFLTEFLTHDALPYPIKARPLSNNYMYCGDWLSFGSIESAMRSGEQAANSLLKFFN